MKELRTADANIGHRLLAIGHWREAPVVNLIRESALTKLRFRVF
jgi:hypothetical protein